MKKLAYKKKMNIKVSAALLLSDFDKLFDFIWDSAVEHHADRYTQTLGKMPRSRFNKLARKMKVKKYGFADIEFDVVDCGQSDWYDRPKGIWYHDIDVFDVTVSYGIAPGFRKA